MSSVLLVLAAGAGLAFMYSGMADVAATSPHWGITRWILSTAMESSVERRAAALWPPASLDEPARVQAGAAAYDEMCAFCHGAPGLEPGATGKGLNPKPPDLAKEAEEWRPEEIFWITKHGIRMTGMPAFGPTHSDAELWDIVALVKRLPRMSPAEYRARTASRDGGKRGRVHAHGDEARREHELGEPR